MKVLPLAVPVYSWCGRGSHGLLAPIGRATPLQGEGSRFESEAVHERDEGDVVPRLPWEQETRRSSRCIPTMVV